LVCFGAYAKDMTLELTNKPLEHFLAKPFNGGDELGKLK
jgi:hypothetical protein